MAGLDRLTHNLKDTVDQLAEGWQEIWHKARNAIIRFIPGDDHDAGSRWGVLSADMHEKSNTIDVMLECPGMETDDFDITVEGSVLRVRGTKAYTNDRTEGHFHITERAFGRFERTIALPCEIDENSGTASYKGGVLHLSFEKHQDATPRRITVDVK